MSRAVKPENYVTCVCGQVCKGRAALANHGAKCPTERERSGMFVAAVECGDWSEYNARWNESMTGRL